MGPECPPRTRADGTRMSSAPALPVVALLCLALVLFVAACGESAEPPAAAPPAIDPSSSDASGNDSASSDQPSGASPSADPPAEARTLPAAPAPEPSAATEILAWVGDEPVTRAELDLALERVDAGGALVTRADRADLERRLLLSLVDARALALLAQGEMPADALRRVDLRARAYREELLVQRYLSDHATPRPVSWQMVEDYYARHPEAFGAARELSFELVRTRRPLTGPARDQAITALAGLDTVDDWAAWTLEQEPLEFDHRASVAKPELLEQPLRGLVERTAVGQVSAIGSGDLLMRVRVTAEREIPPRPLDAVSAEIRRRLAPVQLRNAIRTLAEQATETLGVRYLNDASSAATTAPAEPTQPATASGVDPSRPPPGNAVAQ